MVGRNTTYYDFDFGHAIRYFIDYKREDIIYFGDKVDRHYKINSVSIVQAD